MNMSTQNSKSRRPALWIGSLIIVLATTVFAVGQNPLFNNNGGAPNSSPSGLATGTTTQSGTMAPAGTQWSELQPSTPGGTTEANTSAGFTCTGTFRLADNFTVPAGQTWSITSIDAYAYQTGSNPMTSPFTGATIRVWNGAPGAGGTIIYGDTTTNRLGTTTFSGFYRIFNTVVPPATVPGTTRPIFRNQILTPSLSLTAGTYWIDYAFSGPATAFCPGVTIPGTRGLPSFNARQLTTAPSTWSPVIDTGAPATAPDLPQDLPFQLFGTCTTGCAGASSAVFDFNGDGRSDYAVIRNGATGSGAIWHILEGASTLGVGGTQRQVQWGRSPVGVTPSATNDIALPADYDGDGKADIAVWRPGTEAFFYILRSSDSTFQASQFGRSGDDPRVVDDYDGDGKVDLAVYRSGVNSGTTIPNPGCGTTVPNPSAWYYRPSGTSSVNFLYTCWGQQGDFAVPGDYDGDGRADFVVQRAVSGQGHFFINRSSGGSEVRLFGTGGEFVVPGDYDGDGKTDIALDSTIAGARTFSILQSSNGVERYVRFGVSGDFVVQGDYNGDGRTDVAVWRAGTFYVRTSPDAMGAGSVDFQVQWGQTGDIPPAAYNRR